MSKASWKEQLYLKLSQAAARTQQNNQPLPTSKRVALVGVGNELNGDDAAGNQVAAKLMALSGLPAHFFVINAGSLPENASGPLRRFKPGLVIFVDAANFGGEPGQIQWLDETKIGGMSASSHTLPLTVLGQFLASELDCKVEYLGIQPKQLEFDHELSPELSRAVDEVVAGITSCFGEK
ncbi:MAG: hydrogenase 3 maturation endopeptidase HyCI [Anaerolineaceae bacterium]